MVARRPALLRPRGPRSRVGGRRHVGALVSGWPERIRESISELDIPVADRSIKVTLSLGVAALPDVAPEGGPTELIALADSRLYKAKANGKNRVVSDGE